MMSRYFVEFSYDGSDYHGLQKQPNSVTIQEVIEDNFEKFIGCEINLVLAGRTDAGVHACLLYTSPSPRDLSTSRMPSSA